MMKISLYDKEFDHIVPPSYCGYDRPEHIEWDKKEKNKIAVFTERYFDFDVIDKCKSEIKICWPLESPLIHPLAYSWVKKNWERFDYIITFDEELIRLIPNEKIIYFSPGGSWLWRNEWSIYPKIKNVSIVASMKNWTVGHKLRQKVIALFEDKFDLVCGFDRKPVKNKVDIFEDYRYSVVIENCKENWYWTASLLDSFLCGTVPIFWGCPDIGKYFDTRGMIIFNDADDLATIFPALNEKDYYSRMPYIQENFERAKKFAIVEDYMYDSFFKKLEDDIYV